MLTPTFGNTSERAHDDAHHVGTGTAYYVAPTPGGNGDGTIGKTDAVNAVLDHRSWTGKENTAASVTYTYNTGNAGTVLNATQIAANDQALKVWSDVANISFVKVAGLPATAQMDFSQAALSPGLAGSTSWWYQSGSPLNKMVDTQITYNSASIANPAVGTYAFQVMMHEIGHAIGLTHPGNYNGSQGTPGQTFYDSYDGSVMSYVSGEHVNGAEGYAATPMIYDIAAIQQLYGANTNFNAGATSYVIDGAKKSMTIWDGGGNDTLNASAVAGNHILDLREGMLNVSEVADTNVFIAFNANIENATGGVGNDKITGNALANLLIGGLGNDTLAGEAGVDTLDGGGGTDTYVLKAGGGGDHIVDSDGLGKVVYEGLDLVGLAVAAASNYLLTIANISFTLSLINSQLQVFANNLLAAVIEDFQSGEFGIQLGGDPNTPVPPVPPVVPGFNVINGTANIDTLKGTVNADQISGLDGNDKITAAAGSDKVFGGLGNDSIIGDDGNDTLDGAEGVDTIRGGNGDDMITGAAGNDNLNGDAGNDRLYGGADNDTAAGGVGNDMLWGGLGDDRLSGNEDNDWMDGEAGNDVLTGEAGNDTLLGGDGNDNLNGDADQDSLVGGTGNDSLTGLTGNDTLIGGYGDDTLVGGAGDDMLSDNGGNNSMNGGAGNDSLIATGSSGIAAAHTMAGGTESDTFIFFEGSETAVTYISDFAKGIDKIDLSYLDETFTNIIKGAAAGATVGYTYLNKNTVVTADCDGHDLVFTIKGTLTLDASDFIFG